MRRIAAAALWIRLRMSTAGKSEYARVLGPYHSPNRVHTKINTNKKLSYRRGTARCVLSVEILPISTRFSLSAILDFWNSNFFNGRAVKGPILHQLSKFRIDWSNRCGDIAIFVIFQDSGSRHLGFSKIRNFNGTSAVWVQYASLYQISSKSVKQLLW